VLTRHGTVVGPFMTDLTGYPELTPYKGGWCGNDLFPEAVSDEHRAKAIELVRRLCGRLGQEGYRGFFEVDVLIDLDTDEVYLGELNPASPGASSMTNVTAGAHADIPLFLCHLLEYMDVDYVIDVEEINERWRELAAVDGWAQLIMKECFFLRVNAPATTASRGPTSASPSPKAACRPPPASPGGAGATSTASAPSTSASRWRSRRPSSHSCT
jgi:biotin carboxylase